MYDLDQIKCFNFYIQNITIDYKLCNTIDTQVDNSNTIFNKYLKISTYKLYNNIKIKTIIIKLNKTINTNLILKISNKLIDYTASFYVNNSYTKYCSIPVNIDLNTNDNLYVNIKSELNISNLSAQINIIYTNTDNIGLINYNNTQINVYNNNIFEDDT